MATDHNNNGQAQHSDVAFEHSDLSHRGIWAFFIFLGVSTIVIFLAIGALYKGFGYAQVKLQDEPNPMAVSQPAETASGMQNTRPVDLQKFTANGTQPLLQSNDVYDMDTFRKEEELKLTAAPWKEENGTVHLPIDQAMQLVSQRNQPARADGKNPAIHDPNVVPTEAGFAGAVVPRQQAEAGMTEGSTEAASDSKSQTPEKNAPAPK